MKENIFSLFVHYIAQEIMGLFGVFYSEEWQSWKKQNLAELVLTQI